MKRHKVVSVALKRRAIERVVAGEAASAVAADMKVNRQRIYEWHEQVRRGGVEALRGPGRARKGALDGHPPGSTIFTDGGRIDGGSPSLSARSGSSRSTWIFFGKPCGM